MEGRLKAAAVRLPPVGRLTTREIADRLILTVPILFEGERGGKEGTVLIFLSPLFP